MRSILPLRAILLTASVISSTIGGIVAFEIVDVEPSKTILLSIAWTAWGLALYVAARHPATDWFERKYDR